MVLISDERDFLRSALTSLRHREESGDEKAHAAIVEIEATGDTDKLVEEIEAEIARHKADERLNRKQRIKNLRELATIRLLRGEVELAKTALQTIMSENPRDPVATERLAYISHMQGDLRSAVRGYEEAFEIWKKFPSTKAKAESNLALVRMDQGRFDEAESLLLSSLAAAVESNDVDGIGRTYVNLGNLFLYQRDRTRAKEFYLNAVAQQGGSELNEMKSTAYANLAQICSSELHPSESLSYSQKAIALAEAVGSIERQASAYAAMGCSCLLIFAQRMNPVGR